MNFISEFKHFSSLKKLFPPLRIRQKIVLRYTLSLGIAVLGTSGGLLVGNSYFQTARNKTILINQEDILLNNLQRGILGSLIHQQKIIATLDQPDKLPKEIAELNTEIDKLEIQFTKFQNFTQIQKNGNLSDWSQKYQQNINSYIQLLKELVEKLSQLDAQSNKNPEIRQLILKVYQIKNVEKFSDFAYSLETLRETIRQTKEQANLATSGENYFSF